MKRELEEKMLVALLPCLIPEKVEEAKMRITMAFDGFSVIREEKELMVYEGDVNEQILKKFLIAKIARGLSPRTLKYYKNSIKMMLGRIGKPYNQITSDDIRMYLAIRVQRDGVSKTCANNERRNLSAFYTWLQKEEILLKNPMSKIEPSADVVEVVRCKNCKHRKKNTFCLHNMRYEDDNGFCSYGERVD